MTAWRVDPVDAHHVVHNANYTQYRNRILERPLGGSPSKESKTCVSVENRSKTTANTVHCRRGTKRIYYIIYLFSRATSCIHHTTNSIQYT